MRVIADILADQSAITKERIDRFAGLRRRALARGGMEFREAGPRLYRGYGGSE